MESTVLEIKAREKPIARPKRIKTLEKKEKSQSATPEGGLCLTCTKAPDCALRQTDNTPKIFCEDFDDQAVTVKEEIYQTSQKEKKDEPQLKGLCSTCDLRLTCNFTKPEEGIWHCEEYI
jgi:hypothetical protein